MGDLLLLFGLPGFEKRAAAIVGQEDSTILLFLEVLRCQQFLVDAGQHESVCVNGAKLFHKVQRQTAASGTGAVQEADIRVQPNAAQCGSAVAGQQRIGKGEQRVHIVQRRPTVSGYERKRFMLL